METIMRVVNDLINFSGYTLERLDIQLFTSGTNLNHYFGYAEFKENEKTLLIRDNGSFEWLK